METVDHILSKMREPSCFKGKIPVERVDADFRDFADRLDAAIKREKSAILEDRKRSKYERLHECFWDKRAVQCVIRQMLDERDDLSSIDPVSANRMEFFANLLIGAVRDGKSFGNAAKIRDALKYLRDASREFCHLILNSKYNEVFDKYKYAEVSKIRDAIANAGIVLSAPARNCDIYCTKKELDAAYKKYREYVILSAANPFVAQDELMTKEEWLFAEVEGETDEQ